MTGPHGASSAPKTLLNRPHVRAEEKGVVSLTPVMVYVVLGSNCLLDCGITLIEEAGVNRETLYCLIETVETYGKPFAAGLLVKNGSSCGERKPVATLWGECGLEVWNGVLQMRPTERCSRWRCGPWQKQCAAGHGADCPGG